jgi:hypothetical protein
MRTYKNTLGRLAVLGLSMIVVAVAVSSTSTAQAANVWWEGSVDSNWQVGGPTNWNLGGTAGALTTFNNGDVVRFEDDGDGLNDNGTVVIAAGGVAPASITFNRGFGKVYNISGGDITSGSINGTRDDTKNFTRDGSYSFGGGTFATAGGSNFTYSPSSPGTYNFGTGAITIGSGSFAFNPASPATLTNNFVLTGGGSITGNANASFSGSLTISGNSLTAPQNSTFAFSTVTLSQDTTINLNRCCSVAPAVQFNSKINGAGIHSITLLSGNGNADWTSRVGTPSGTWDVKNITKTERGRLQFDANNTNDFFSGLKANGGTFYHRGGMIEFRNAAGVTKTTFDLDFPFMFAPDPSVVGPAANQTGSGFYGITTLNVNNGGVIGGFGTVASTLNIGGNNPTFSLPISLNVNNGGKIAPGMSASILNVLGNVNFLGDTSELEIEIGGTSVGTQYDQLNVSGIASLNGILDVSFINGFNNLVLNSDSFTILNAASINGLFDNITFGRVKTSDGAGSFLASIVGNSLVLSDFQITPAPEPSTALLLGLGLVGLSARRRKVRS